MPEERASAKNSNGADELSWSELGHPTTLLQMLDRTADRFRDEPAVSFQILADPGSKSETLNWEEFRRKSYQTANLFRSLGIGERDVVAYLLPNSIETALVFVGGAIAGIVNPINPLLSVEQIAGILEDSNAKVLVTLKSFPKTDVAQKASAALALAPCVDTVLEVDLAKYLAFPKSLIVKLIRPKVEVAHSAKVLDFTAEVGRQHESALDFSDSKGDRVAAYFHTGGTTGTPKLAQHLYSGMIYNGAATHKIIVNQSDTVLCPLPLFHVFAAYPVLMSCICAGAHMVLPTPAGYRGDGVFDNFWKLVERWRASFLVTVPTAISVLMQRPVDADVSSLKCAISGSAPLTQELFSRFEDMTGLKLLEGYGLTEATCLVSVNPFDGVRKVGSVGLPMRHTKVRILECEEDGTVIRECGTGETGEICISNPGVYVGSTYTNPNRNIGLFADGEWLRTGDLGRIDEDGYVWISGRSKDLIIRGGRNIDPALIEETLAKKNEIAFVGAIGQPHAKLGELPCAYVELIEGAKSSNEEILEFARSAITYTEAVPVYVEVMDELPKTAVGKVFKPDLRRKAITRVLDQALGKRDLSARVREVVEDKELGLVAVIDLNGSSKQEVQPVLGEFAVQWRVGGPD